MKLEKSKALESIQFAIRKDWLVGLICNRRGSELLGQWEEVVGAREARKLSFASSFLRGVTGSLSPVEPSSLGDLIWSNHILQQEVMK